jgi:WD40 repeat protein
MMLSVELLCGCQPALLARIGVTNREEKTLKLTVEYKKNILQDTSAEGRLLLFYQTSTPTRSYTIPLYSRRGRANQPLTSDDVLRVVERENGREVGRIKVEFFPESAQFIPGTQQVFYKEPASDKGKYLFKVWSFSTGEAKACSDADVTNFRYARVVDTRHVFGAVLQENGGESLGKLALPDCRQTVIGSADPADSKNRIRSQPILSTAKNHLAYVLGGTLEEALVRDALTLNVVKRIRSPSGLFLGDTIYTPDGKYLLIVASNALNIDKPETKRYLLFFDTASYKIVRQLDITKWRLPDLGDRAIGSSQIGTAMTVSPDGRLLAVGNTKEEGRASSGTERGQVTLYDLETGGEVATASHPSVKQQRNDPFAAKITRLAFTADGKYLLSSTYDTRVWQIESATGK